MSQTGEPRTGPSAPVQPPLYPWFLCVPTFTTLLLYFCCLCCLQTIFCFFSANHTVSKIGVESRSLLEPVIWSLATDMQTESRRKTKKTYRETKEWFDYRTSKRFQYLECWENIYAKANWKMYIEMCKFIFFLFSFSDDILFISAFFPHDLALILMSSSKSLYFYHN